MKSTLDQIKDVLNKINNMMSEPDGYVVAQPSTFTTTTVTTTTFRTRTKINNRKKCKPRYIRNR